MHIAPIRQIASMKSFIHFAPVFLASADTPTAISALVIKVKSPTRPPKSIGTISTTRRAVMKVVCESAPHFLSPLPTRSVPRCIGLHTKILARTVDVIGMHITHMIMPNAFASALARSRFNALRAMLEAISLYDTEPITDRRNHAYGMPITITSVTSPIAMAIHGTI